MEVIFIVIRCIILTGASILAGWGIPYVFNRIPSKWLCDYNQEPDQEMWGERISKYPWSWVFTLMFLGAVFWIWDMGPIYQAAALPALWFLLIVALADQKYMIIPDQFIIALSVTSIGFIPFQPNLMSQLSGALIGGASFLIIGIIGQWILHKEVMGFGDVKLMAAIGLISGFKGTVIILILTFFSSGVIMGVRLLAGRLKKEDVQPFGPFIASAATVYILFSPWLLLLAERYIFTI